MARKARLNAPAVFHHVMARGIDGRELFHDEADYRSFIGLLEEGVKDSGYVVYAWVLMKNHYHLLVRSSEEPLETLMRPLNSRFAQYYNRKHERNGYVFQDRFKSLITQDQNYVEELLCYIHLNPIRAGLCKDICHLAQFRWSGHPALLGNTKWNFQDTKSVLRRFGRNDGDARSNYLSLLKKKLLAERDENLMSVLRKSNEGRTNKNQTACWVIGDPDFVKQVLKRDKERRLTIARYKREGWDTARLASFVSKSMGIDTADLIYPSRRNKIAAARKLFCFLGYRILRFPARDLGAYIGVIPATIVNAAKEGKQIAQEKGVNLS